MVPSSPASIIDLIRRLAGCLRRLCPTWTATPDRAADSPTRLASGTVSVSGFSTKTCLPAPAAAAAIPACVELGGGHDHAADLGIVEHRLEVADRPAAVLLRERGSRVGGSREARDDLGGAGGASALGQHGPEPPETHEAEPNRVHVRRSFRLRRPVVPQASRASSTGRHEGGLPQPDPRSSGLVISIGIAA
jgi:hypothetical protein